MDASSFDYEDFYYGGDGQLPEQCCENPCCVSLDASAAVYSLRSADGEQFFCSACHPAFGPAQVATSNSIATLTPAAKEEELMSQRAALIFCWNELFDSNDETIVRRISDFLRIAHAACISVTISSSVDDTFKNSAPRYSSAPAVSQAESSLPQLDVRSERGRSEGSSRLGGEYYSNMDRDSTAVETSPFAADRDVGFSRPERGVGSDWTAQDGFDDAKAARMTRGFLGLDRQDSFVDSSVDPSDDYQFDKDLQRALQLSAELALESSGERQTSSASTAIALPEDDFANDVELQRALYNSATRSIDSDATFLDY